MFQQVTMKSIKLHLIGIAMLCPLMAYAQDDSARTPAKVKLTLQSTYTENAKPYRKEKEWADSIYELTKGEVEIEYHDTNFYAEPDPKHSVDKLAIIFSDSTPSTWTTR